MEIEKIKEKLKAFFLRDKIPFAAKSDVNWTVVRNCLLGSLGVGILVVLCLPAPQLEQSTFHEKLEPGSSAPQESRTAQDPTEQTIDQWNRGALPHQSRFTLEGGGGNQASDRNAPMILTRDGKDSKTQIPAGSRIAVRLREKATVSTTGMPVIGIVVNDYVHEDTVAIPKGSKLFGDVSFDQSSDRARMQWKAVELPDGRERQIAATSLGRDGQVGIEGNVHSNAVQNTVGATLSRFIGAYAEGSMQRGSWGGNPGGGDNGLKNAIAETAKDRADAFAEGLKKEKRWIELDAGAEFYAVLTSNFVFRDPGATYGR